MENPIGVCKDCGNGTLNNETNPAFDVDGDRVTCNSCGSSHVDVVEPVAPISREELHARLIAR